jgi:urease accessory protein
MVSILQAIWQADGTFPNGSFAFSYGVEGFIARRPELDQAGVAELVATILRHRWLTCDRVALTQAFRAAVNLDAIAEVDRAVEASTFGSTMREGSRRNGGSFLASHARLGDVMALRLRAAVRSCVCLGHVAVMQGAVWQAIGLDERMAQLVSGYGVASSVTATAVRLGAIGALAGQKVLRGCLPIIEALVAEPVPDDAELSSFVPLLEIAAARHARADVRLFSN